MTEGRWASPWMTVLGAVLALTVMGIAFDAYRLAVSMPSEPLIAFVESMALGQGLASLAVVGFALAWPARLRWRGEIGLGLWVLGAYFVWMLLWVPFSLILYPRFVTTEAQPHLEYFVTEGARSGLPVVLVVVCLVGPIAEGVVFRGYLQTGVKGLIGRWPASITTSLLFGFMHGVDIGLPLALMGLFFGYLRDRDGGMVVPIAAHVLHNSVTVGSALGWPELFHEVFSK